MNTTENITTQLPPQKASRWVWYLVLTFLVQFIALIFTSIAKNPPRGAAYREQVIHAMFFSLLPFAWSVFLIVKRRTVGESVVAYVALLLSLFWLRDMIWLVENFYAA